MTALELLCITARDPLLFGPAITSSKPRLADSSALDRGCCDGSCFHSHARSGVRHLTHHCPRCGTKWPDLDACHEPLLFIITPMFSITSSWSPFSAPRAHGARLDGLLLGDHLLWKTWFFSLSETSRSQCHCGLSARWKSCP